jgi:hypothetical protein
MTSKNVTFVWVATLLALGLVLAPSALLAGQRHGGRGASVRIGVAPRSGFVHRPPLHSGFGFRTHGLHGRGFFRPFVPFVAGAPVVVSTVTVAPAAPAFVVPSVAPIVVAPPPMPQVVEYPHGRYVLHGDGVSTPFTWVWVPNPPPPPPPPPSEPQAPPPAREPRSDPAPAPERRESSAGSGALYCFTDERGVTFWTDHLSKVPERYRAEVRRPNEVVTRPGCRASG